MTWLFAIGLGVTVVAGVALYIWMEARTRSAPAGNTSTAPHRIPGGNHLAR